MKNVAKTPLVSGQWRLGNDSKYDLIVTSNAATLLAGMTLIGLTTVLPIYIQGVLGRSPIVAGFTLSMLVFGWRAPRYLRGRYLESELRLAQRVQADLWPQARPAGEGLAFAAAAVAAMRLRRIMTFLLVDGWWGERVTGLTA